MNDYELLYIVSGELNEEAAAKATDGINAAILAAGGKVTSEQPWGRRRLSYPIAKQDHGWYVVSLISVAPEKMNELQQALRLHKDVLRFLLLRAEEVPSSEEAAKTLEAVTASEAADAKAAETKAKPQPKATAKTDKPTKSTAKKETAADAKKRQAKLDEKLGELLSDESNKDSA